MSNPAIRVTGRRASADAQIKSLYSERKTLHNEQRRHDLERPLLAPDALYMSPDILREQLNQGARIEVCGDSHPQFARAQALASQPAPALPITARSCTSQQHTVALP